MNSIKLAVYPVGSNPLPVYVSIRAMTEMECFFDYRCDKILLLVSENTLAYAENIVLSLPQCKEMFVDFCDLGSDHRDAIKIGAKLQNRLHRIKEDSEIESVVLNYTGGTKVMALSIYAVLGKLFAETPERLILSDLDPDKHRLNVVHKDSIRSLPADGDITDHIDCTIEEILKLHGVNTKLKDDDEYNDEFLWGMNLPKLLLQLCQSTYQKCNYDAAFCEKWQKAKEIKRVKKVKTELYKKLRETCEIDGLSEVMKQLSLPEEITELKSFAMLEENRDKLYSLCEFVHGKWLEHLFFGYIRKYFEKTETKYSDIKMGSEPIFLGASSSDKIQKQGDSEIDIMFMIGYRLFLVTCTTASKIGTVKQKAFEGIYRAKQLGGEQACVIVVSMISEALHGNNNLETLRTTLKSFDMDKNVLLLGNDSMLGIANNDSEIIKSVDTKINKLLKQGR